MHPFISYRKHKNLTQAAFADLVGLSQGAVADIERGRRRVSALRAIEIEEKTGGHVDRSKLRPDIFNVRNILSAAG